SASTASRRVVRTKSDKGPITASPNCSRALSSAWAAGASPTRSRSSSARASCRAVTCATAPSAWRRAARPWVSCSLSSATRGRALCQEPVAPLLLEGGTTRQLLPDGREVALRRLALGRGRSALPLRLQGACFFLLPPLRRSGAPLTGIAQPLGGERQVTLQPPRLELRIGQAALHLRATRLGRRPRLDPGLPLPPRLLESGPLARQGCRQLLGPLPQAAQRQIEVFELAPHQRQRDTKALLDHLAVALRFAALPRQAPHLRLHLADQVFEPGEIRRRFFEAALGAGPAIAVQPDPGCLF